MARQRKLGDRGGVREWQALNSVGDVRRFLRWVILSTRNQTLDVKAAGVFSQLGMAMLKTVEVEAVERRLADLERTLEEPPRMVSETDSHLSETLQ